MPHIKQDPVTKRWRARVKRTLYGPDGAQVRRWSKTFHTKTAAREWGLRLEDLIDGGGDPDAPDPRASAPTVREWHARWWAARVAEPTTLAGDETRLRNHVLPRWGDVPLDAVSPVEVQGWVRQLSKRLAADTVRKTHGLLSQMCDDAVKERLIVVSPCQHTDLPTVPPGRELWLTEEQVTAIADAAADLQGLSKTQAKLGAALIWTLYLTGARWGEATGLRVQDLDFLRRRIRIGQVSTRRGLKGYPKGRRNRTVPMPGQLAEVLAEHLRHAAPEGVDEGAHRLVGATGGVGQVDHRTLHAPERSALVFANAHGGPVSDANFRHRVWKPAVAAAGLGCPKDAPEACRAGRCGHLNPRLHDLRHSLASRLVQQGVPLVEIAAQLGHSSVLVAARYAHLGEGRHDAVLRALEGPDAGPQSGGAAADG